MKDAAFGLGVRFELGRFHATPWTAHVNDGQVEWPPSPWRLLRAVFSAARTDIRLEGERQAVDAALQRVLTSPPPRYRLPASAISHTRHYVPDRNGNRDLILDAFRAVPVDDELMVWWEVALTPDERSALERAAASIRYLGRSESVCSVRVLSEVPRGGRLTAPVTADEDEAVVDVLCPSPDATLDQLTASVGALRAQGRVLPPGTRWVSYDAHDPVRRTLADVTASPLPTLAILRLSGASRPNLREAVTVGESVRRQLQRRYGERTGGHASSALSGHHDGAKRTDQHRHAHFLSLPEGDGRRIDRVAIWAAEGLGPDVVGALASLRSLKLRGASKPLTVSLVGLGDVSAMTEARLLGPARVWRSATPFALPRHSKRRAGRTVELPEQQIARELAYRGTVAPDAVELLRGDWLSFRRMRSGGSRLDAPSSVGARLHFAEPVAGPLALGLLSHFGLGLFLAEDP